MRKTALRYLNIGALRASLADATKIDQSRTQDGSRNVVMSFEIFLITQPLHIRASMPESG